MFGINNKRKREQEDIPPPSAEAIHVVPLPSLPSAKVGESPPVPHPGEGSTSVQERTTLLAKALAQVTSTEAALKDALGTVADAHNELNGVQLAITNKWEDGSELQELLVRREMLMTLQARAEMQEKSARIAHRAAEARLRSVYQEIERYKEALQDHATIRNRILQRIEETKNRMTVFETDIEEHDQRVARLIQELHRLGGTVD